MVLVLCRDERIVKQVIEEFNSEYNLGGFLRQGANWLIQLKVNDQKYEQAVGELIEKGGCMAVGILGFEHWI